MANCSLPETIRERTVHVQYAPASMSYFSLSVCKLPDSNQSCGNAKGIRTMVARKDLVVNEDVVLWHTFALTHQPRVEDFVREVLLRSRHSDSTLAYLYLFLAGC
jgi:Copper amine oxidase, enzyme domain